MNIFSKMLDFLLQINNWMELNTKYDKTKETTNGHALKKIY